MEFEPLFGITSTITNMATSKLEGYHLHLFEILKQEEKILPFLDVIFGFLYEKTDFYRSYDGKLGFQPGEAEKLVLNVFHKYQKLSEVDDGSKNDASHKLADMTDIGSEVQITSDSVADKKKVLNKFKKTEAQQLESDSFNGAILENYRWSQSINDIDIRIAVAKNITSSKMVRVKIDHREMATSILDAEQTWKVIANGKFSKKINLGNSVWTLVPGEHIHISVEKLEERWWDCLLEGDPTIDITKIENVKLVEDLPESEQAELEELLYNEQQKLIGKPTSKEMKIHDLMKEAWDKPGSPFQGQKFDPSLYSVNSNLS